MKPLVTLILFAFLAGCATPPANTGVKPTASLESSIPVTIPLEPGRQVGFAPLALTQGGVTRLHLIDLSSGLDVPEATLLAMPAGGELSASAASADQTHLALVSGIGLSCQSYAGGSSCTQSADTLHLVDTVAWQMLDVPLSGRGGVSQLAFNPDGTRLALAYNTEDDSVLLVYNVSNGEQTARLDLDIRPEWLAYVLDGETLAVFGVPPSEDPGIVQPPAPRLLLLDPGSLRAGRELRFDSLLSGEWCLENCTESHEQRLSTLWKPAVTLSPDSSRLYIVLADQETLTSIDLAQGAVHDAAIETATSWLERLLSSTAEVAHAKGRAQGAIKNAAISPDGSRLYVLTQSFTSGPEAEYEGQQLQVVDLTNRESPGRVLANVDLDRERYVYAMHPISKGVQLLLLGYVGDKFFNEAVSASTLDPTDSLTGWEITQSNGLLLGKRDILTGSELAIIDPISLEILQSRQVDGVATWLPSP